MKICEIFHSIQGESTFAGLPCIFIRLTGCNLRCHYCDTTYSYEGGQEYTVDNILQQIRQFDCTLIEITGGEPLLQDDAIELIERLEKERFTILVETNGTQSVQNLPSAVRIIIDVKLPGSGHPDSFLEENLKYLKTEWDELKFVVSDRRDFETAMEFIATHNLQKHILLFSPVSEKLAPSILAKWVTELKYPARLNLQLHKYIWDKERRGV